MQTVLVAFSIAKNINIYFQADQQYFLYSSIYIYFFILCK